MRNDQARINHIYKHTHIQQIDDATQRTFSMSNSIASIIQIKQRQYRQCHRWNFCRVRQVWQTDWIFDRENFSNDVCLILLFSLCCRVRCNSLRKTRNEMGVNMNASMTHAYVCANYTNIPCYICLMKRIHKHKTHTSRDKQFSENSILENWKIFGREKITEILQSVDRLIRSTINSKVQYTKNVRIHTSTLQITPYDFLAMAK